MEFCTPKGGFGFGVGVLFEKELDNALQADVRGVV
jgi:hypothetical protein